METHTFVLLIFGFYFCPTDQSATFERICEADSIQVKDNNGAVTVCFKFFNESKTWLEAQLTCQKIYGNLIVLDETYYENAGVQKINALNRAIRTLLHDSGAKSSWTALQVSGGKLWWHQKVPQPVALGDSSALWKWASGQPLLHQGKCVQASNKMHRELINAKIQQIELSLHPCEEKQPFICVHSGYIIKTTHVSQCPVGWNGSLYSEKCWKFIHNQPLSYRGAAEKCKENGGVLASPNTDLQHKLMIYTVKQYYEKELSLTCITCRNAGNEEECQQQGQLQRCASKNQACMTIVKLQPGRMYFSKKCEELTKCNADLEGTKQICHSKDIVFQNGFTEVYCYECCNTTGCNTKIMDGDGALAETLNNFNNSMQPSSLKQDSRHGAINIHNPALELNFWIGLTKDGNTYTWESKSNYSSKFSRFLPTFDVSPDQGCVRVLGSAWEVINCDEPLPFVCETKAVYGKSVLVKQPKDIALVSHNIDWKQSKYRHHHLICQIDGYYPELPVLWVKDGIYHSNGLPPAGFVLNLTKDLIYHLNPQQQHILASLQGYYHCEVWAANGTTKISSRPALVTFKDILTYQGSLQISHFNLSTSLENSLLRWGALKYIQDNIMCLEVLTRVYVTTYLFTPEVQIKGYKPGSKFTLDFSLYYILSRVPAGYWPGVIDALNVTITWDHRNRYRKFITELDKKFQQHLKETVEQNHNKTHCNIARNSVGLNLHNLTLHSTIACHEEYITTSGGLFRFLTTKKDTIGYSDEICFSDGKALATQLCSGNFMTGVMWGPADFYKECVQPKYTPVTLQLKELYETRINKNNINKMSESVVSLTKSWHALNFVDVDYASKILRNLAESRHLNQQVGERMLECIDNLLRVSRKTIAAAQLIDRASSRLIQSLDTFSRKLMMNGPFFTRFVQPGLALEIWESQNLSEIAIGFGIKQEILQTAENNDSFVNFFSRNGVFHTSQNFTGVETAVLFSQDVFTMTRDFFTFEDEMLDIFGVRMSSNKVRMSYTIHQHSSFFMTPSQLYNHSIQYKANSQVISGEVNGVPIANLTIPVKAIFTPIRNISIKKQYCAYWNFSAAGGLGNWSTDGCWMEDFKDGRITCFCNHLTNFAVMAEVEYSEISQGHALALGVITMIGIILSIVGLTLTIFTYVLFRNLRKGMSQKALVNLAVSLLIVNIVFLVGVERTDNYYGCLTVAILLHYFLLVSFGWMLVEGILQYIKFVKVLNTYIEHFMFKTVIPVWGCPAIILIIVAAVDWRLFRGQDKFCWIDLNAFYYAFLLPVGCVIIVNTVLFILVVKGITCDRPKGLTSTQSKSELTWLQVKATVSCFIVLGLTWIFGFFALKSAKLVFQYLFCILNAFQGFWIFLCYCIREPAVRTHWWNLLHCKKHLSHSKHSHTTSSVFSSNQSRKERSSPTACNIIGLLDNKKKSSVSQTSSDSSQTFCDINSDTSEKHPNDKCDNNYSNTDGANKKISSFSDGLIDKNNLSYKSVNNRLLDKHAVYENLPVTNTSNVYVNVNSVSNLVDQFDKKSDRNDKLDKVYVNVGYDVTET